MTATMPTTAQLEETVVAKLRVWNPAASAADLDRSLFELNLDSLDTLEVTHLLERECRVTADLDTLADFDTFRQYIDYFRSAADPS